MHANSKFDPILNPDMLSLEQLDSMGDEEFRAVAGATPMMRAGLERLRRNARLNAREHLDR
jgi:epoxyqueuosine reductase QueG